jgi:hypothetical protein
MPDTDIVNLDREVLIRDIAGTISLSYGENPHDLAPINRMCDVNDQPVECWQVYKEQAEAVVDMLETLNRVSGVPKTDTITDELDQKALNRAYAAYDKAFPDASDVTYDGLRAGIRAYVSDTRVSGLPELLDFEACQAIVHALAAALAGDGFDGGDFDGLNPDAFNRALIWANRQAWRAAPETR